MPRTNTINAIISGTGIMIGRFSGLVREILFAYLFGTSSLIGLFKYAFALPNLARRIFGEGALSNAFIPILADLEKKNQYKAEEFCSKTISLFTFFNIILACLGIIVLIICGKTGLIAEENQQLVELGSIMFPYLPFICLCGILGSILNLHNSYKIPSLMSSTMNICLIASSCFAIYMGIIPENAVKILAWTLLFSGLIQVIILLREARKKINFRCMFTTTKDPILSKFWVNFFPILLGASAQQISTILDKTIALWIGAHAVAALSYSELLIYLPVGVIGVALGSVCLPSLSKSLAKGDINEVERSFTTALRQVFFLAIPCSLFFYICGEEILKCIFMRGAFDQESLEYTLLAFKWFIPGIPFFAALKVVLPLFYAHQNTKTPLKISVSMIFLNLILGLAFIPLLEHGSLAMASSVSGTLNFILLLYSAIKNKYIESFQTADIIIKILTPACIASLITFYINNSLKFHFISTDFNYIKFVNVGINFFVFSGIYLSVCKLMKVKINTSNKA